MKFASSSVVLSLLVSLTLLQSTLSLPVPEASVPSTSSALEILAADIPGGLGSPAPAHPKPNPKDPAHHDKPTPHKPKPGKPHKPLPHKPGKPHKKPEPHKPKPKPKHTLKSRALDAEDEHEILAGPAEPARPKPKNPVPHKPGKPAPKPGKPHKKPEPHKPKPGKP
ncbi:hypothetical protein BGX29_002149, partial [Mortierella sp. GBA35]